MYSRIRIENKSVQPPTVRSSLRRKIREIVMKSKHCGAVRSVLLLLFLLLLLLFTCLFFAYFCVWDFCLSICLFVFVCLVGWLVGWDFVLFVCLFIWFFVCLFFLNIEGNVKFKGQLNVNTFKN